MKKNETYSFIEELGIALLIIGVQLGTAINNVLPVSSFKWSYLFMFISVVCTINYGNLRQGKLPMFCKDYISIMAFMILALIYLYVTPILAPVMLIEKSKDIVMECFVLLSVFALSTQSLKKIHVADRILFYLTAFINLVVFYQMTRGLTGLYTSNVLFDDNGANTMREGGDKITMGRALLLSVLCCVVYKHHNRFELILRCILPFTALWSLFIFNTRASISCIVICYFAFLWKRSVCYHINMLTGMFARIFIVAMVVVIGYMAVPPFQTMLDHAVGNIISGVESYFNGMGASAFDTSGAYRFNKLLFFLDKMDKSSIMQILIGHGALTAFYDFPILQVISDLGLIGLIIYLLSIIWLYIKHILFYFSMHPLFLIVQLFSIQYLLDQFYVGYPYWSFQWMPLVVLIFVKQIAAPLCKIHRRLRI